MVSQKKGNPSERVNLAEGTQRGLGETGKNPVFISHYFIARLRTGNNVPQNYENMIPAFFAVVGPRLRVSTTAEVGSFFLFFWGSK